MRFPNYDSKGATSRQVFDAYLAYLGERNFLDPYTDYDPNTRQHAAALLAQGCTQLTVEGNERQAKKTFLNARRIFIASEGMESANNENTLGLGGTIHAAALRKQAGVITQSRESLHIKVMQKLDESLLKANDAEVQNSQRGVEKIYRGKINRLTALGLLTRYGANAIWAHARMDGTPIRSGGSYLGNMTKPYSPMRWPNWISSAATF